MSPRPIVFSNAEPNFTFPEVIKDHIFKNFHYLAYDHVYFHHINEHESRLRHLFPHPDKTFIDVGAACGTWTLPAAMMYRKVMALEPFIKMFELLKANVELNQLKNVSLLYAAAWDHCSKDQLVSCNAGDYADACVRYASRVPAVTIDYLKLEDVGMIKIDVEGAELRVLHGALETLKAQKPDVMVEIHTPCGVTIDSIVHFMTWVDARYSCTLMPQGPPDERSDDSSVFGQQVPTHYHAMFRVVEPECKEFAAEFKPKEEAENVREVDI